KIDSSKAIFTVKHEIKKNWIQSVPPHLKDKTANKVSSSYLGIENASDDYKFPHDYNSHLVEQQYLPDGLKSRRWYEGGSEGREPRMMERLNSIKKSSGHRERE